MQARCSPNHHSTHRCVEPMRSPEKTAEYVRKANERRARYRLSVVPSPSAGIRREFHVHESKTGKRTWQFRIVSVCLAPLYWAGSSRGSTLVLSVGELAHNRGFSVRHRQNAPGQISTHKTFDEARERAVHLLTAAHEQHERLGGRDVVWFWFSCAGTCPRCPPEVQVRMGSIQSKSSAGAYTRRR